MRTWQVQPSEFWRMEPRHFWALYDAEIKAQAAAAGKTKPGELTVQEVRRLKRVAGMDE